VAPQVAISAALAAPLKNRASEAADVTRGVLTQGEATRPDGPQAQARAGEKLAAAAGAAPLAKGPDARGGALNSETDNKRAAGKPVARGASGAMPTRVLRVGPAPVKAAAARRAPAPAEPGAAASAFGDAFGASASPVFSISSGAAAAPLEGAALREKAAEAAAPLAPPAAAAEVVEKEAKENHFSDTPKAAPAALTPPALGRQLSLTNKAEQAEAFEANANVAAEVVEPGGAPALLAAAGAGLAAAYTSSAKQPAAEADALPDAEPLKASPAASAASAASAAALPSNVAPFEADALTDAEALALLGREPANVAPGATAMLAAAAPYAPTNDNFAAAQVITGLPGSASGSNLGATREAGEPFHAYNQGGASVWFRWQAPSTGTVDFTTAGSSFDTTLAVYKGTAVGALSEVASNDEVAAATSTSRVTFDAVAGAVYYVAVDGRNDGVSTAQGSVMLNWSVTPKPANDSFAAAQALAAATSGSATGTTRGATHETGEPYHANNDGAKSVWYKWQAPATGSIEFTTAGSDFDTLLGVYTGAAVGSLTGVASNDEEDANAAVHTSRVVFNAVAGTVYYIAVDGFHDGYAPDWGAVSLQWKVGPAVPANNGFAGAQAITGDEGRVTGSNWLATKETGEPNHAGVAGGKSVWFKFTAPGAGKVTFDTVGSAVDTAMAVYTGTAVSALTQVAANDDADPALGLFTSRVSFEAAAGVTYYIAVDAWYAEGGSIVLRTPRKRGKIAFVSSRDGDEEIFTMNADGSEQKQLTANAASDSYPRWSPDGSKIAFSSTRDGNSEIYVMNADGTNPVRLTTSAGSDREPTWSPDGSKIAFSSGRDSADGAGYELYVMNADGTNPVRLTFQAGNDMQPHWSPDGGMLIFMSNFYGNYELHHISPVTGGDQWRMTVSPVNEWHPTWSPDGLRMAFHQGGEIYVGDPINIRRVTESAGADETPAWSPESDQLLFTSARDGNQDVYVMNADGSGPENVTFNLAGDSYPDWQPVTATPNNLPTVALTAPADGTKYAAPATIALTATAGDVGGSVARVSFYNGSTLLATDTAAPYSFSWTPVAAGAYSLTAVATDNRGATATTGVTRVVVTPALGVNVVNPAAGTTFDTGAKVTISAEAAANTNAISKVDFYYAAAATPATRTLIGSDAAAPYSVQWSSPATAGGYVLSATVTDSALATATSANVAVTLKAKVINPPAAACARTITAKVVAFDQVYTYNRFGAFNPGGMMYALERDVVAIDASSGATSRGLVAGNVQLRPDKRPRPLVLRMNEGDCLQVTFRNLLTRNRSEVEGLNFTNQPDQQTYTKAPVKLLQNDTTFTRTASMHVNGLEYVNSPSTSDGAHVGNNASSLVEPDGVKTYTWYGRKQGQYMVHSLGAPVGGEGDGGQTVLGLFGAVVVEPQGAKWYRSQVTADKLAAVTTGRNPDGTPKINFEAADASGPILNMLSSANEIVHTDVNALITGFAENCTNAPPSSTCGQPFREFVVVFHDETKTVQAFPELDEELFHGVRDGFAINYGSNSLGAPLLANRKKLGPAKDCGECKFEEFFLESWANGDPAMVVRKDSYGRVNEVLFPDDPSNVHHSYLGDPVRFRNIHVGPKETHVFHLHAHQWLHEPREDDSTYLDSQTIGVGAGFTYEINYGGSGNRNFTAGDSIFHCHLYPHFAQGMWELWRVHDAFEAGTPDRRLPDAEIAGGTPNPAVVPLPNRAMAPMPSATFKGFPFFVDAQAGHRPPQPPLDMEQDGGLPRHRIAASEFIDGKAAIEPALLADPVANRVMTQNTDPNLLNFARKLTSAELVFLDPKGTAMEQKAMEFHEGKGGVNVMTQYGWPAKGFPAYTPSGAAGLFLVNGQPRQPGAPFAEPCAPGTPTRDYRAAYIQFDMTVNRAGWHDRQARITTLEDDALPTRDGARSPEPFFFRANSNDCVRFAATNLIPHVLNLDDFQIFTPTDTIGQHIHLVKFDVTSSDGAGNGWNYEDGTFSPGEVQERVEAHNHFVAGSTAKTLTLATNLKFGAGPDLDGNKIGDYVGAQTTVQRWWADPLLNNAGDDRTIRTVFTHDHFGPSSHQHHGLYGALVVEPQGSKWETLAGTAMATRLDGGPTSYAANIVPGDATKSYREFNLAIADFALVYRQDLTPVNPPGRNEIGLPFILEAPVVPRPEAISADDPGTGLINYRNEPIPLRIANGAVLKTGPLGDLSNVFRSKDNQGVALHGDPFTPLLQAYEGDKVQIRLIQGAQEEQHVFSLHGGKWLHEPSAANSGWYNAQAIGISEHFEFDVPPIPAVGNVAGGNPDVADFMYGSFATDNLWNGMWGILRSYKGLRSGLKALPNNSAGSVSSSDPGLRTDFCPAGAPQKPFSVEAWLAKDLVGADGITYNQKFGLKDPAGIVFVQTGDVAAVKAKTRKLEPLVLRVNAGDCVNVQLTNKLPLDAAVPMPDYDAWNFMPMIVPNFNLNQVKASKEVSLHPQLVEYDVRTSDGANVGVNDKQTVSPGETRKYRWYAGKVTVNADQSRTAVPIEYGAINLTDYGDIMKHGSHGAGGVLVVEPKGATWTTPTNTYAEAEVKSSTGALLFKEFVLVTQDDVKMVGPNAGQGRTILGLPGVNPVRNFTTESDAEDSGAKAFNYRTEPLWARLGFLDEMTKRDHTTFLEEGDVSALLNNVNQAAVFSSAAHGDPATPVFSAPAGAAVRFRVVQPTGHPRQHAFTLYGHNWFHEAWTQDSTVLWTPSTAEPSSMTIGTQGGHTSRRHWNLVLRSAGGAFKQPGDYMYRTQESFQFTGGLWGIFRVTPTASSTTTSSTILPAEDVAQ
jgi:Tol biopolymer transport system component